MKDLLAPHITAGFEWLLTSIKATEGKGSAASFHLWKGWSKGYPETTGYSIDTLFDGHYVLQIESLKNAAIESVDWLCAIQNGNGSFPSGVGGMLKPIVFDVGMIAFALTRAFQETRRKKYLTALENAIDWLLLQLEPNGTWTKHAYVDLYYPSYYSMVIWSILKANQVLKKNGLEIKMIEALQTLQEKIDGKTLSIKDWGFEENENAFTHTIAYTLQGLFESSLIVNLESLKTQVKHILDKVLELRNKKSKLAGSYDYKWNGDYSFSCLTGDAQFSILYFRLYEVSGDEKYLKEGNNILSMLLKRQFFIPVKGIYGGIPGSHPIGGNYQSFQFPNWAVKFFLDACLLARKYSH